MNISLLNLNLNTVQKLSRNIIKKQPISFKSQADTVEFSNNSEKYSDIKEQLINAGYSEDSTYEMIKRYTGTNGYRKMVYGTNDKQVGKYYSHSVDMERGLYPAEAVVYLAENMDDYYKQHYPICRLPENCKSYDSAGIEDYDIGRADFSPIELAKKMNEGYPMVVAGMILKDKIDEATAARVLSYYEISQESREEVPNVQASECLIEKLAYNIDRLDELTSKNRDEDGKLESGLKRSLFPKEAFYGLIEGKFDIEDTDSINNYIKQNDISIGLAAATLDMTFDQARKLFY